MLPQSSTVQDGEDDNLKKVVGILWSPGARHSRRLRQTSPMHKSSRRRCMHLPKELEVGTKVLLENTAQQQKKGGKMEPLRLGPYMINRCLSKGIYEQ